MAIFRVLLTTRFGIGLLILALPMFVYQHGQSQTAIRISPEVALERAFQNNLSLQANQLSIENARLLTGSWFDLPAQVESTLQERLLQLETLHLQTSAAAALQAVRRAEEALRFYETTGMRQADEILKAAELAFRAGEIGFAELSQFVMQAVGIRQNYLDALNEYNQAAIEFNYFVNQ